MAISLNPTDELVLDYLREGRITAGYVSENEDVTGGNVTTRLSRLVEHGYVEKLSHGLYELKQDPREETNG